MIRRLFLLALILLAAPASAAPGPLVLGAASLQEALGEAAEAWARLGHRRPVLSFAASSTLARQIEAGAPADLFVSADEAWMDMIERKGLVRAGTRVDLAGNRLVLVAPRRAARAIAIRPGFPLARALGPDGRLALADPDSVPAGRYGRAALVRLGVWPSVAGRIARTDSVRSALSLVERGAAPLGIVYATDARASAKVLPVGLFPAASHPPILYPLALLTASRHPEAAGFYRFLRSDATRAIFTRRGFLRP